MAAIITNTNYEWILNPSATSEQTVQNRAATAAALSEEQTSKVTQTRETGGDRVSLGNEGTDKNLLPFSHNHTQALQGYLNLKQGPAADAKETAARAQNGLDTTEDESLQLPGTVQNDDEEAKSKGTGDSEDTDKVANTGDDNLTEEEQEEVEDLKARDEEVRQHEQQHQAAGGQYASAPSYTYTQGPDGKSYVSDGEVDIDISEESDPDKTIEKMQAVQRAALAPAEPSTQDRKVAAEAAAIEAQARAEKLNADEETDEAQGGTETADATEINAGAANAKTLSYLQNDPVLGQYIDIAA